MSVVNLREGDAVLLYDGVSHSTTAVEGDRLLALLFYDDVVAVPPVTEFPAARFTVIPGPQLQSPGSFQRHTHGSVLHSLFLERGREPRSRVVPSWNSENQ